MIVIILQNNRSRINRYFSFHVAFARISMLNYDLSISFLQLSSIHAIPWAAVVTIVVYLFSFISSILYTFK